MNLAQGSPRSAHPVAVYSGWSIHRYSHPTKPKGDKPNETLSYMLWVLGGGDGFLHITTTSKTKEKEMKSEARSSLTQPPNFTTLTLSLGFFTGFNFSSTAPLAFFFFCITVRLRVYFSSVFSFCFLLKEHYKPLPLISDNLQSARESSFLLLFPSCGFTSFLSTNVSPPHPLPHYFIPSVLVSLPSLFSTYFSLSSFSPLLSLSLLYLYLSFFISLFVPPSHLLVTVKSGPQTKPRYTCPGHFAPSRF